MSSRVVAWISDEEWIDVYNKLFYGNLEEQHAGLDIINLWQIRFAEKIPVAIEATYVLMEAWLKHTELAEIAQKLLFSSAVMQFVGLITERGLKGNFKKPIHLVGMELDIPEWIITLRHEMAHGPLPSKHLLSKALLFGLDWLKSKHWDIHFNIMKKSQAHKSKPKPAETTKDLDHENFEDTDINECELRSEFQQFLKTYMDLSHEGIYLNKSNRFEANLVADKITSKVLKFPGSVDYLCKILIEGNFLCYQPNNDPQFEKDSTEVFQLTDKCIAFWKPIFYTFKTNKGFEKLVFLISTQLFHLNFDLTNNSNFKIPSIYYAYVKWAPYFVDIIVSLYGLDLESIDDTSRTTLKKCLKILRLNSDQFSKQLLLKLESLVANDICSDSTGTENMDDFVIHSIDEINSMENSKTENKSAIDMNMDPGIQSYSEDSENMQDDFSSYLGLGPDQTCTLLTESFFGIESEMERENVKVLENNQLGNSAANQTFYSKVKGGEKVPNMFDSFSQENWASILNSM